MPQQDHRKDLCQCTDQNALRVPYTTLHIKVSYKATQSESANNLNLERAVSQCILGPVMRTVEKLPVSSTACGCARTSQRPAG